MNATIIFWDMNVLYASYLMIVKTRKQPIFDPRVPQSEPYSAQKRPKFEIYKKWMPSCEFLCEKNYSMYDLGFWWPVLENRAFFAPFDPLLTHFWPLGYPKIDKNQKFNQTDAIIEFVVWK